ncbi:MAG: SRPBCC family protein [Candidatus Thermoplasmatota archaeon]
MVAIKRTATIASPQEDAFEYVADWRNFPNYVPMFTDMSVSSLVQYGPGTSVDLTMLFGDKVEMRVALDIVDFLKNQRVVFKSSRGLRTRIAWTFKESGDKTLVTLDFDFEMPPTMNLREAEKLALAQTMEEAWGKSLDMLKWILESMPKRAE